MIRRVIAIILLLGTILLIGAAEPPKVSATAYAVADVQTGRILISKNGDRRLEMASTTKIMTAILALESGKLNEVVTIPREATGIEGSSIYLKPGEQFTFEGLVYGLMLRSGNDAATAIALYLGGSIEGFSSMMNEKARELGAENTNFVNPHGLPHSAHYTTAEDLAKITAYCLNNEMFVKIVSTKYIEVYPAGEGTKRTFQNKNKLLWNYSGATGVKTGYTTKAGKCLVASAFREGIHVAAVVLKCSGDMWNDASELMDFTLESCCLEEIIIKGEYIETVTVKEGRADSVELFAEYGYSLPLLISGEDNVTTESILPESVKAPVEKGQRIGELIVYLNGSEVQRIPLVSYCSIEEDTFLKRLKLIICNFLGLY